MLDCSLEDADLVVGVLQKKTGSRLRGLEYRIAELHQLDQPMLLLFIDHDEPRECITIPPESVCVCVVPTAFQQVF